MTCTASDFVMTLAWGFGIGSVFSSVAIIVLTRYFKK